MPEFLEHGGAVELWAGWSALLPPSYHQPNEDGSWSAWGNDWAIDAHIIEVGSAPTGEAATPECLFGVEKPVSLIGNGWIGTTNLLTEKDGTREVFRLVARLAAVNTVLSFWVSYFSEHQHEFAVGLVQGVAHHANAA